MCWACFSIQNFKLNDITITHLASLIIHKVALDYVGAGIGEWVLVSRGSAARQIPGSQDCPSDAAIVGIIDTVNTKTGTIYSKRDQDR